MTFYVIRHIPTGQLMPARVRATHWDFDDPNGVWEPRLFRTHRAAANCATLWSKGCYACDEYREQDGWENPSYKVRDLPAPVPVDSRRREHLEVIPVLLVLKPASPEPAIWVSPSFFKKAPK